MVYDPRSAMRLNNPPGDQGNPPPWTNQALAPSHGMPMPDPRSEYSPVPDQTNQVAAAETVGETDKPAELQPGNRKSIKEYLADIRQLREQQRLMGMAEDQLAVPTFTNIQGGALDVEQGQLTRPGDFDDGQGGMVEEPVRSYVDPEWQQGPGGAGDMQMGTAHPVRQAQERLAGSPGIQNIKSVSNPIDPRRPAAVAFDLIDDSVEAFYQKNGTYPNEQQVDQMFMSLRKQAFEEQGKLISQLKKDHKDADVQSLWKAYETGNWGYAADAGQNMLSQERLGKTADGASKTWNELEQKNMRPMQPETGEYFNSMEEYVQFKVQEYQEMVQNLLGAMGEMQSGSTGGPQTDLKPTGGPQQDYAPPGEAQAGGGELPPQAKASLQQGMVTTFQNGQKWTLDQNGQPQKVQ